VPWQRPDAPASKQRTLGIVSPSLKVSQPAGSLVRLLASTNPRYQNPKSPTATRSNWRSERQLGSRRTFAAFPGTGPLDFLHRSIRAGRLRWRLRAIPRIPFTLPRRSILRAPCPSCYHHNNKKVYNTLLSLSRTSCAIAPVMCSADEHSSKIPQVDFPDQLTCIVQPLYDWQDGASVKHTSPANEN